MAKKTKEESTTEVKKKPSALGFMKALSKETGTESFSDSKLTKVSHYISTGNYALNRIISGSIYKGLPAGIISVFAGDSASMKTVLSFRMAANAVKENGYDCIIYVDSEGGSNRGMLENVGLDPSIVQYIPVSNIEECTIKLIQTYKTIEKYQQETDPDFKALIILDSIGGLVSEKVLLDADKDKTAGDLGGAAKKCLHPDTLVLMANNEYKMLKDINVGDEVVTHLGNAKPVIDKFTTKHSKLVKIKVAGKEIKCSTNHKFLIKRDGELTFCEAAELKLTDNLMQFIQFIPPAYSELFIESIEIIDEEIDLIDIEVKDDHTFLITDIDIITHNCSSMIRSCTMPALKTGCGMIIISQTYDNPGALFKSKLFNMRGGKSLLYQPSLVVQLSRRLEKGTEKEDNFYEDSVITAFTVKTRNNVRPFLETEMKLSFKNGFSGYEYYGLLPDAIRLGFIENPKVGWYTVPSAGEKQYRLKELIGGPEAKKIWDTFIDEFDKVSAEDISYKSLSDNNMTETERQLKEELQQKFNISFGESEEADQQEEA